MQIVAAIWSFIKLVLELIGLYHEAEDASQTAKDAEAEKRSEDRNQAVDDSTKAETDEEIWASQDAIVSNRPKP